MIRVMAPWAGRTQRMLRRAGLARPWPRCGHRPPLSLPTCGHRAPPNHGLQPHNMRLPRTTPDDGGARGREGVLFYYSTEQENLVHEGGTTPRDGLTDLVKKRENSPQAGHRYVQVYKAHEGERKLPHGARSETRRTREWAARRCQQHRATPAGDGL